MTAQSIIDKLRKVEPYVYYLSRELGAVFKMRAIPESEVAGGPLGQVLVVAAAGSMASSEMERAARKQVQQDAWGSMVKSFLTPSGINLMNETLRKHICGLAYVADDAFPELVDDGVPGSGRVDGKGLDFIDLTVGAPDEVDSGEAMVLVAALPAGIRQGLYVYLMRGSLELGADDLATFR